MNSRRVWPHVILWSVPHKRARRHKSWLTIDRGTTAWAAATPANHTGRQRSGINIRGFRVIGRLPRPVVLFKRNITREIPQRRAKPRLEAHLPEIRIIPLDVQHLQLSLA